jgi:hypothetical protein
MVMLGGESKVKVLHSIVRGTDGVHGNVER